MRRLHFRPLFVFNHSLLLSASINCFVFSLFCFYFTRFSSFFIKSFVSLSVLLTNQKKTEKLSVLQVPQQTHLFSSIFQSGKPLEKTLELITVYVLVHLYVRLTGCLSVSLWVSWNIRLPGIFPQFRFLFGSFRFSLGLQCKTAPHISQLSTS